jgi:acetyl-CoA carboxylase, biotin carboxylase subunit
MIRRVLIANRGEIAVRIIRACRRLGIETVQVYSEADAESLPVRLADRTIGIGRSPARESYLNPAALISAAIFGDCDAIHPGYGFLSESAAFAELCTRRGFVFIGPKPDIIQRMGDKAAARELARAASVPIVPGSEGAVSDPEDAQSIARAIGYPVLLKAAGGGGGRGMRVVERPQHLASELAAARTEAGAAFGDSRVYIERYLPDIRHVEVQVVGDGASVIHVGERDCTIQRRHQKLVEETPSPALDSRLRDELTNTAVRLATCVGYTSLGTVEFILDARTGAFYFIEMNTRLQVEHPVTEMASGIDLVQLQIRLAAGEQLALDQEDVSLSGCAIECRINAERPDRGFMPQPGTITGVRLPEGSHIRIDTHVVPGAVISPYYDSLVAKVVVRGKTRHEAIVQMRHALNELSIEGVETNVDLHRAILADPRFVAGAFNTGFLDVLLETDEVFAAQKAPLQ